MIAQHNNHGKSLRSEGLKNFLSGWACRSLYRSTSRCDYRWAVGIRRVPISSHCSMSWLATPWRLEDWAVATLLMQHLKGAEDGNGGGRTASGAKMEITAQPTTAESCDDSCADPLCEWIPLSGWCASWLAASGDLGRASAIRQMNFRLRLHRLSACLKRAEGETSSERSHFTVSWVFVQSKPVETRRTQVYTHRAISYGNPRL